MCDCFSYQTQKGLIGQKILDIRKYFPSYHKQKVCIDFCIAEVIEALWKERILTNGSCCGHGKKQPSIVMENGDQASKAREVISKIDSRNFKLLAWKLCEL